MHFLFLLSLFFLQPAPWSTELTILVCRAEAHTGREEEDGRSQVSEGAELPTGLGLLTSTQGTQ